jgi:hypothetical protein
MISWADFGLSRNPASAGTGIIRRTGVPGTEWPVAGRDPVIASGVTSGSNGVVGSDSDIPAILA